MDKPYPGWTPPSLGRDDECMRLSFACATGLHPIKMRFIDPDDRDNFWSEWRTLAWEKGYILLNCWSPEEAAELSTHGFWIACVPVLPNPLTHEHHAVTMKDDKLWYDCSDYPRVRRPKKIIDSLAVVKLPDEFK